VSPLVEIQLLNGVVQGMIYALVAVGLTLIFGMLAIPNFAHGAFYALGAFLTYAVVAATGNFLLAVVCVPIAVALLGCVIDRIAIRRLAHEGHVYQILFLVGLVLIVQEGINLIWGADPVSVPIPDALSAGLPLGLVSYPYYRLLLVAIAVVVITVVWLALQRTKYGAIIRAGIDDPQMVDCIGIDMNRLFTIVFGIGVGLAALAGALTIPINGGSPTMGENLVGISFAVVVIGGLGSFLGAIVSSLLIGLTQAAATIIFPAAADVSVFFVMIAVILIRPQGLFGAR
jgi:branched-chain amino acid transport system permease protein